VIDERPGQVYCRVTGKRAAACFADEAGGHRWQRVPPTEKRGRVHSSTVTVCVLAPTAEARVSILPDDIEEQFTRGSGAGGQHRNKTSTTVLLRHKPSGLLLRVDGGRSQSCNRETAMELLQARLQAQAKEAAIAGRNAARKQQAGSGMRGDKIRTVQVQGDVVVDHRRGTRMSYRMYARGQVDALRSGSAE
jgi:peptide chain release factor 1